MFLLKFTLTVPGEKKAAAFSNQSSQKLLETNNVQNVLCSPVGPPSYNHNVALSQVKTGSLRHLLCSGVGLYLRFLGFFLFMPTTEKTIRSCEV